MRAFPAAVTAALLAGLPATSQAQTSSALDARVQAPEIAAPQRGSLVGQLASTVFGPADLARGGFSLPAPFAVPGERGALVAEVFPTYSPDAGMSEWGMGWRTNLVVTRSRVLGDLDYATDELTGPWGRMVRGSDGYWYPVGLSKPVRLSWSLDTLVAYLPDGTQMTFGGAAKIANAKGSYAWALLDVTTVTGRRTSLGWQANASGRLFLSSVSYGGVGADFQYRIDLAYEPLGVPFVDYRSGFPLALDQRVKKVTMLVKDAGTGLFVERWHHDLAYQDEGLGPASYLATVQQVFRLGDAPPPVRYTYNLAQAKLASATLAPAPKVGPVLVALGSDAFQPNRSTIFDADLDGLQDLEHNTENKLIHQTDTGFAIEALPPSPPDLFGRCRRPANVTNAPRLLAPMGGDDTSYVVDLFPDSGRITTALSVCNRLGQRLGSQTLTGDWQPASNVRLVDLNRDRKPDLVRVGSGEYRILPSTGTANTFSFGAMKRVLITPVFAPDTSWVHDFNGDGIPDLIARSATSIVVWYGKGNYEFETQGRAFSVRTAIGTINNLTAYAFTFVDANKDGLTDLVLSNAAGNATSLFVNRGTYFQELPLVALRSVDSLMSKPVVADFTGSGNVEISFTKSGQGYAVALDGPETGLMATADDGKGTVLSFSYARAKPAAGQRQRQSVLSRLAVVSSGQDPVSYAYDFAGPHLHSVGKFFLGFDQVTRTDPLLTHQVSFLNEDRYSGVFLSSAQHDVKAPGADAFASKTYDEALFQAVPWKRLKQEVVGFKDATGATVSEQTDYLAYVRDFCPQTVKRTTSAGALTSTKTYLQPASFGPALSCLWTNVVEQGSHADPTLDFRHEANLTRNAVGLVEKVESVNGLERWVIQSATFRPTDWLIDTLSSPGKGVASFAYDPVTRLLSRVTAPDGVVIEALSRDPLHDGILTLRTTRGTISYQRFFTFDGQERLQSHRDDLGAATSLNPSVRYSYQFATATEPAAVFSSTLVDAASASARDAVALLTAGGEPVVTAGHIPEGWAFGPVLTRSRATGLTSRYLRPSAAPAVDPMALDYPTLLAGASQVGSEVASPLQGQAVDARTTFHAGVEQQVGRAFALSGGLLQLTSTENGQNPTQTWLDAGKRVVAFDDEASTHFAYRYDALGRLREVVLPDGNKHRARYDAHGRVWRVERDGVATVETSFHPTTGLAVTKRFLAPAGALVRSVAFAYDGIGRGTSEVHTDAVTSATKTFTSYYDGATPSAPAARTTLSLLTAVTGDGYQKLLGYRADGLVTSRSVQLMGWRRVDTSFGYLEGGEVGSRTVTVRDGAGAALSSTTQRYVHDTAGRLQSVRLEVGAGPPASRTVYLSDEQRLAETFTYVPAVNDRSVGGGAIKLNGVAYAKGIGAHAVSELTYDLGGMSCSLFQVDVGLDDEVTSDTCGAVTFEVHGDGAKLFDSGLMRSSTPTRAVSLDITGRSQLKLVVTLGDGNNFCDHADWAAARVTCSPDLVTYRYGGYGELRSARFATGERVSLDYDPLTRRTTGTMQAASGYLTATTQRMNARGLVDGETFAVEPPSVTISGDTVPDVTGVYVRAGTLNGVSTYLRQGLAGGRQYNLHRHSWTYQGTVYSAWFLTTTASGYPTADDPFWFTYTTGLDTLLPAQGATGTAQPGAGVPLVRGYGYSPQRFLTSASDAQTSYGYDFDGFGLPRSITTNGATRSITRSGSTLTAGAVTYSFDSLGRTVARSSPPLALTYGPDGQVASASNGTASWTFVYDESGQRLAKLAGGVPVAAYLEEGFLDASGLYERVQVGGRTVGLLVNGVFTAVPTDLRGTVMAETTGAARIASPFGHRDVHPAVAVALDYVEKGYDADMGLVRMGLRDYDPEVNRFTTPDPAFLERPGQCVRSPIECNLYAYVRGDPLSLIDPTGEGAAEIADAWEKNRQEYRQWLLHEIKPDLSTTKAFGLAVTTLSVELGAGLMDLARLGEGAAEGGVRGWGRDALRAVGISTLAWGLARAAVPAPAPKAQAPAAIRPATDQPVGGKGVVLSDGAGATPAEIAASRGGPTAGSRGGQAAIRQELLDEAQASGEPYRCWRCGQTSTNPQDMHVGHRNVPASEGGNLEPVNVCLEGAACNLSAGNRGAPSAGMSCAERGSCGAPYDR